MDSSKTTLWVFGDSNTEGHGCRPNFEYYQKYYKEGDKIWPEWLSEYLGIHLVNRGKSGASNDLILDRIIDSFDEIKVGDVVIIGKTYSHRFDIPQKGQLIPIFWDWEVFAPTPIISEFTQEEIEIIIDFLYHFMDSPLFDKRWDKRFEWVKSLLETKGCKVVVWDVNKELIRMESIFGATKGKVDDWHMSFRGHKDFSIHMLNKWFKEKTLL
jgi:hypothetical protein